MRRILVTGGAGFVGYHISKILSKNIENEIHITDDLSTGKKDEEFKKLVKKSNVTFHKMDLTNLDTYCEIQSEYDQIYHLAAVVGVKKVINNPALTIKVNTLSTIYLLEHIKKMENRPKILYASSCENYAGSVKSCNVQIPTPEDIPLCIEDVYNPRWSYAITKILGEVACLHYSKQYDFDTTIVRYHNIYGPRMGIQHVISEFILRLKKDPKKLEMFGGYQHRAFCYITDAAKMTMNLMNNKRANNKVVNIGNDRECVKISSIEKKLSQIMKISPKFIEKGAPEGSPEKRMPDLKRIRELGAYESEVSLSQGLINTFKWYNERY